MANDPIQEIKDLANIVELISEIIPVKRSGASYVALCPFHNDTNASMNISPTKGIFKCFSCGVGGDVFKFWSEFYQKDFPETLKDLANKYGVKLETSNQSKEDTERFNKKIQMHELAAKFYNEQLLAASEASKAREYLEKRQIPTATITTFKLGYSPEESNRLIRLIKEKLNFNEDEVVNAGLALKSDNDGSYFDRFRGRLMVPVFDERSRVIAFGARILDPNSKLAKYINSSETEIYNKGSNLFGLNLAKEEIRKKDYVILVEGYFDLISLYKAGFKNVVANQGTALTAKQIKLLVKYSHSKKIYLCLDSDKAGREASDRAAELIPTVLKDIEHEIRIIQVPGDKDPDDFLKSNPSEAFQALIDKAPLYIDYKINEILAQTDLSSVNAKAKSIKEISKYLAMISNRVIFSEYQRRIAEKLSIDETALSIELNKNINTSGNPYAEMDSAPKKNQELVMRKSKLVNGHFMETENILHSAEQEIIIFCLKDKNFIQEFMSSEQCFVTGLHQQIFDKLIDVSFENPDVSNSDQKYLLLNQALNENRDLVEALSEIGVKLEKTEFPREDLQEYFAVLLRRLRKAGLRLQISEIKKEITELDESNQAKMQKILEKAALEKELHSLKI